MVVAVDLLDATSVHQHSNGDGAVADEAGSDASDASPQGKAVRLPLTTIQVGRGAGLVDHLLWPQAPKDAVDPGCAPPLPSPLL